MAHHFHRKLKIENQMLCFDGPLFLQKTQNKIENQMSYFDGPSFSKKTQNKNENQMF